MNIFNFFRPREKEYFVQNWEFARKSNRSRFTEKAKAIGGKPPAVFLFFLAVLLGGTLFLRKRAKNPPPPAVNNSPSPAAASPSLPGSVAGLKKVFAEDKSRLENMTDENIRKFPKVDWKIEIKD